MPSGLTTAKPPVVGSVPQNVALELPCPAASVRRDDERQRRVVVPRVPGREQDHGVADAAVVGAVLDGDRADARRRAGPGSGGQGGLGGRRGR